MSTLLKLFLTFLKIGAVSFGGGYGMISLIREEVLANAWLTETELNSFIAVAESTPGPIAINMATFIGSTQAGIIGSLLCTLGVVLPSLIIILIIASALKNLLEYKVVNSILESIKPCIAGLITATGTVMFLSAILSLKNVNSNIVFDYKSLIILALIVCFAFTYKKLFKKKVSPIILILFSAVLGMLLYAL